MALLQSGAWEGHEWVYGRQIASPEKMATEIPSLMEKDGMFFCTFTSSEYEILDIMTLCIYSRES